MGLVMLCMGALAYFVVIGGRRLVARSLRD